MASVWGLRPDQLNLGVMTLKFAQYPSISMKLRVKNAGCNENAAVKPAEF
jgi:hypothetical protein